MELEAGIVGRDPDVLVPFYTGVMGFETTDRHDFPDLGTVVKLRSDRARMKIFFPAAPLDPPAADEPWFRAGGWRYAALSVDGAHRVDALAAAMVEAGGRSLVTPTDHRPGARMAMVTDPEGNPWELLYEAPPGVSPAV